MSEQKKSRWIQFFRSLWTAIYRERRKLRNIVFAYGLTGFLFVILLVFLLAYENSLVDIRLIISLVIAEVPIGVLLHYLLGQDRNPAFDAIARMQAIERFAHLEIHRVHAWGDFYYPDLLYFVVNTKTKKAYYATNEIRVLAKRGLIKRVVYRKPRTRKKDLYRYLTDNRIELVKRTPNMRELGISTETEESSV